MQFQLYSIFICYKLSNLIVRHLLCEFCFIYNLGSKRTYIYTFLIYILFWKHFKASLVPKDFLWPSQYLCLAIMAVTTVQKCDTTMKRKQSPSNPCHLLKKMLGILFFQELLCGFLMRIEFSLLLLSTIKWDVVLYSSCLCQLFKLVPQKR